MGRVLFSGKQCIKCYSCFIVVPCFSFIPPRETLKYHSNLPYLGDSGQWHWSITCAKEENPKYYGPSVHFHLCKIKNSCLILEKWNMQIHQSTPGENAMEPNVLSGCHLSQYFSFLFSLSLAGYWLPRCPIFNWVPGELPSDKKLDWPDPGPGLGT